MYFLAGDQKSARNFYLRPNFGHLNTIPILHFLAYFSKLLTLEVAGGQKFRAFCPKIVPAKKICIFWPEIKNWPEISISGRNLPI